MFLRALAGGAALLFSLSVAQAQVALDRPTAAHPALATLADGFDFPLGKPDAAGYYKARGFSLHNHPGEDWDGVGGGNSDFNDAVSSIGDGVVAFAGDVHRGWGNVIIIRHKFRENGAVQTVDSFFAHLNSVFVHRGEVVTRGQKIGTVGTAHGLYPAHLHFEIRKNLDIGINRAAFPCDFSCYYDPTRFIQTHRPRRAPGSSGALYACNRRLSLRAPAEANRAVALFP